MLLVRIVENNKIYDYFRAGLVKYMLALSCRVRREIRIEPRRYCVNKLTKKNLPIFW